MLKISISKMLVLVVVCVGLCEGTGHSSGFALLGFSSPFSPSEAEREEDTKKRASALVAKIAEEATRQYSNPVYEVGDSFDQTKVPSDRRRPSPRKDPNSPLAPSRVPKVPNDESAQQSAGSPWW